MDNDALSSGPVLSDEQFRRLARYGEPERAEAGRQMYTPGDETYDFFLLGTAIVDVVRGATVTEPERLIYRGRPGDFRGELNLLTGQHVYLFARVVSAGTIVRIGPAVLRRAMAEHADLADVLLEAFRVRRDEIRVAAGSALQIVGRPDTAETLGLRTYVSQLYLPHAWLDATSPPGRTLMHSTGVGEGASAVSSVHLFLYSSATRCLDSTGTR